MLKFKCDCTLKGCCPEMKVTDYLEGDFEFKIDGKAVYLSPKSVKRLIKYLSKR
jgi:hypothetical protein